MCLWKSADATYKYKWPHEAQEFTTNMGSSSYQGTVFVEYLRWYLTLVLVKIFPNVLQSLQKNLENSWTQAVDATLILPTISISCGSLKIRKWKDIKHFLSTYICIDLLFVLIHTYTQIYTVLME